VGGDVNTEDFDRIIDSFGFTEGISGKDEYFNSAVMILIVPVDGQYHVVFQKRSKGIRQPGEISFPGGKADEDDRTLEAAALRETMEEMGVPSSAIRVIGRLKTVVAPMGATVDAFVGVTDAQIQDMRCNACEVAEVFTLPLSFFLNREPEEYSVRLQIHPSYIDSNTGKEIVLLPVDEIGLPDMYRQPWGNFRYRVFVYRTDFGAIWGITARLLRDFAAQIKEQVRRTAASGGG